MIKLISLNIEGDKHFETFMPFLVHEMPDVLCLQEVFEADLPRIAAETGRKCAAFYPRCMRNLRLAEGLESSPWGVAIFSRLPFENPSGHYYLGTADIIPVFKKSDDPENEPNTNNLVLVRADIRAGDQSFTICTTHFTWTPEGKVTEYQLQNQNALFKVLHSIPEFVLCGDLNAPRGKETWNRFAAKYKDNIPAHYETSLDQNLHRKKGLMYVVDGLFTTPKYKADAVQLVDGVSDHMAIVADISIL